MTDTDNAAIAEQAASIRSMTDTAAIAEKAAAIRSKAGIQQQLHDDAWVIREAAVKPARDAYDRLVREADAALAKAIEDATKDRDRARASASKAYSAIMAPADRVYNQTVKG